MADGEYHVASFVVRTRPENADSVASHINSMTGLEVHTQQDGKLVVTAEGSNAREMAEMATSLEQVEAVIAVAPVYHEYTNENDVAGPEPRDK
jgi:nitrate reductase NapD